MWSSPTLSSSTSSGRESFVVVVLIAWLITLIFCLIDFTVFWLIDLPYFFYAGLLTLSSSTSSGRESLCICCFDCLLIINSFLQCCGSGMFIPDPTFFHPGSRIPGFRIRTVSIPDPHQKNLNILTPKKWFLSCRKYDPGFSSWIPDPDAYFLPIPDTGSRGQKGTGSWIRIRNSGFLLPDRFRLFLLIPYFCLFLY